jgi:hypothetical protein
VICEHSTRELVCPRCDLAHWDSKGREVERGDPRATGVTLREPTKHRGGCSGEWPGMGNLEIQAGTLAYMGRKLAKEAREVSQWLAERDPSIVFQYGKCDCGKGEWHTFQRCVDRTPDESWKAAVSAHAAKRNSSPVVETLPVRSTRVGVKRKTSQKRNGR